jgi:uncharacterized SAM-binding protein YcdF (DUF218 family)
MRTAIVVPGHGAVGFDGVYRISRRCRRVVAEAERIARLVSPDLVVFTGWSPTGGLTEAEQMRDAWRGPRVELLTEPTARITAENAARTLPLLLDRGIGRVVVVCTPSHLARARFFFGRLYAAHDVTTRFSVARVVPSPTAIARELFALPLCRRQLRAARAELERAAT